jgi:hypothetical protein
MHRRRDLILLLAASAALVVIIQGCGRLPPAAYWSWSAQDSTRVTALINDWKDSLMSHFEDDSALSESVNYVSDTLRSFFLPSALGSNPYKQHWFPSQFYRRFDSLHVMVDSVTQVQDTTVAVTLYEDFAGHVMIHIDSATKYLRDTTIGGFTYPVYTTRYLPRDSVFPNDTVISLAFSGTATRYLFIEPTNKVKRDAWFVKRISGGALYYSPSVASAPFLGSLRLTTASGVDDTVVLRPDSLHYGIQRLYARDSLLTFKVGDPVTLDWTAGGTALLGNYWWDPPDLFGFLYLPNPNDPNHYIRKNIHMSQPYTTFTFDSPGLKQIYVEIVPSANLIQFQDNYTSTIWGLPIQVTP